MRKLMAIVLITALCAVLISGFAVAEEKTYTIGYVVNDLNDTWVSIVIDYVRQWDEEHPEVEVLIGDGKSDVSTQMAVVEGWIEIGVDAVCLKPVDFEASKAIRDEVMAAGIKYVALQQNPGDVDCFVGANGVTTGRNQMQATIDLLGGKGKIAYLAGTEGTLVAQERRDGSMEALQASECELVAEQDGDWLRNEAINIVETWIISDIKFDAICAACDEMAIGAIIAMQNQGLDPTQIIVTGIDGTAMAFEQMDAGALDVTFYADAKGLAYEALDAALALAKGENPEDVELLDLLVTPENIDEFREMAGGAAD